MTLEDTKLHTPILDALRAGGYIESYSLASLRHPSKSDTFDYWFRVNFRSLHQPLEFYHPFNEGGIRIRESLAYVRQEYGPAIEGALLEEKERMFQDLALIYRRRLAGEGVEMPDAIGVNTTVALKEDVS